MDVSARPGARVHETSPLSKSRLRGISGRTNLQRQQKETNRKKLLKAARTLLAKRHYTSVTIDDIIQSAKVSRATFYHHFRSKIEVVMDLGVESIPETLRQFEQLASLKDPSQAQLEKWLGALLDRYEKMRVVIRTMLEVVAIEPEYYDGVLRQRGDLIRVLGAGIPAFAAAAAQAETSGLAWIRAHALLESMDYHLVAVGTRDAPFDRARVVTMLAQDFRRFIVEVADS